MIRNFLVVATLLVLLPTIVVAQTVIHAGKLINGQDGKVYNEMSIVVEDGKIKSVEDGYVDPDKFGDAFLTMQISRCVRRPTRRKP